MNLELIKIAQAQEVNTISIDGSSLKEQNELITGTEHTIETEEHSEGLTLDYGVIGFQILNFIILLVILNQILFKPLVKLLDERQKKIADGVANAEQAEILLQESEATRTKMLKEARAEGQSLIEESRNSGEQVRGEIIEKAQSEAQQIINAGQVALDNERSKAFSELKNEATNLIIQVTEKLLKEKLDKDRDEKLVNEAIEAYLK